MLLGAVFLSNLPSAIASSSGMRKSRSIKCLHHHSMTLGHDCVTASCVGGYMFLVSLPAAAKASCLLWLLAASSRCSLTDVPGGFQGRDHGLRLLPPYGSRAPLGLAI